MMVHMSIDNDEQLEKTCGKCQSELDKNKCIACGTEIKDEDYNESFDDEYFNKLKEGQ